LTSSAEPKIAVTVVINNYNYGRFLAAAIDSALAQSYPRTEVVVVDDGSSDNSAAVIASYGERIVAVFKENGGQASALNAGLARSQGEVIIFLDADDMLHPALVERVLPYFRTGSGVVRVQYRLQVINAEGVESATTKPPQQTAIPSGDLRRRVLLYGDDIPWLPTSGNAFSAAMLSRIFPIPETPYRICADYYLSNLSPLFGEIAAMDGIGGYYRVHGGNHHETATIVPAQIRQLIVRSRQTHDYLRRYARQLGLPCEAVASRSLTLLANHLISLRLEPAQHPVKEETRFGLARRGVAAAWRRSDLPLLLRLLYTAWFFLAALLPQAAVPWLALQFFYPHARGQWFNGVLTTARRLRPTPNLQRRASP
jgi:glycosyltransferase involved in cell wall biosynthesis